MAEYTYKDILTAKDIVTQEISVIDLLGRERKGWFFNSMPEDLDANVLYRLQRPRRLTYVDPFSTTPFKDDKGCNYCIFLPEKEPEKRYVPFDLNSEKDRDFLRGKWMRSKNLDVEGFIDYFWKIVREGEDVWKAHMSNHGVIYADHLLSNYVFLDGSPVGKLVEVTDGN